jgi:hypothetical protein
MCELKGKSKPTTYNGEIPLSSVEETWEDFLLHKKIQSL